MSNLINADIFMKGYEEISKQRMDGLRAMGKIVNKTIIEGRDDKMDLFKYLNKSMMERYVKEGKGNIEDRKELANEWEFLKTIEYNNKLIKDRIHLAKDAEFRKDIQNHVKQTDEYLKQRIDKLVKALNGECKEETIQDSKEYKEMQEEIERVHTYECAKAYFKLHEANDFIKEQLPIKTKDDEILVFVDGYAFAVSFNDIKHYHTIGDDGIFEYYEDDKCKEHFRKVGNEEYDEQYVYEDLIWNAIEFMEDED